MGNCGGCFAGLNKKGDGPAAAPKGPEKAHAQHEEPLLPTKDVKGKSGGYMSHAQFILEKPGKIMNSYNMEVKKLGEGSYGSVCKGTDKSTNQVRAIKTIAKAKMKNVQRFKQEIAIMKMMDHPNIIKLYETFEDHRNVYLVMELCSGGELFDRIIESGHFTETQCAVLMKQIIHAIYYMHNNMICHRDLKPENFLFMSRDPIDNNLLKIIDFGLSCKFEKGQVLTTKAGTPYYVAPQVLSGKYDQSSDLWSAGVIMYVMLCGYPPFYGETDSDVLAKVRRGEYSFAAADWKHISEDAKNLIRNLLKMKPQERFTAEQSLNHAWIKNKAPSATNVSLQAGLVDNLNRFRSANRLKKAALHIIAGQLEEGKIKALRETFMSLDSNGDGLLSAAEMKEGLMKAGLKNVPPDLQQILKDVDSDGSGQIDYTEFLAASLDERLFMKQDVCWSAFRVFDQNGDGKISPQELKNVLQSDDVQAVSTAESIQKMLKDCDKNGDGFIDFEEFMEMMGCKGKK